MDTTMNEFQKRREEHWKEMTRLDQEAGQFRREADYWKSEAERIDYNLEHCGEILQQLSEEFEKETSFSKTDFTFLFLAVGLQLIRQYVTRYNERTSHDISEVESKDKQKTVFDKIGKDADDVSKRYYYASTQSILSTLGVPYDVVKGSKAFNLGDGIDKNLGLSGNTHRIKTLGHDPVLGYVFGTCNIMTSTLTTNTFRTFHVRGGFVVNNADLGLMFKYSTDRALHDPQALIASFVKQYFHIKSDMYSYDGIQLPFISVASEDAVQWLNEIGLDFGNVLTIGKQVGLSILINRILFMLYSLTHLNGDKGIIKAKGRKIITYANIISSSSNVVKVLATKNLNDLDVGGLIVTIYQIIKNEDIQQQIRDEYVYGGYEKMLELREYQENQ